MSAQPLEWPRFMMFFVISLLVVFVAQGLGLMIGAWFDVVVSIRLYYSEPPLQFDSFHRTEPSLDLQFLCPS